MIIYKKKFNKKLNKLKMITNTLLKLKKKSKF